MIPLSLISTTAPRLRLVMLHQSIMELTIELGSMNDLLHILSDTFDGMVWPISIKSCDHARQLKLTLSTEPWLVHQLIGAIVRQLPAASIGRVVHA